jgi:putative FmdB family regulatory protein
LALEGCECQEDDVPTYQYACTACGHQLEAVQSFADDPLTECPACEGRLRKLFSSVGVVFKGSGFYRTDSRTGSSSGEPGASSGESGASKDSAAKDSGTKDSGTKDSPAKDSAPAKGSSTSTAPAAPKKAAAAPAAS